MEEGSQGRHCLTATHHFCKDALGSDDSAAGTSQKVNDLFNAFYVQCFRSPHKERIHHGVLNHKNTTVLVVHFAAIVHTLMTALQLPVSGAKKRQILEAMVVVSPKKSTKTVWLLLATRRIFQPGHILYVAQTISYTDENKIVKVCDLNLNINLSSGKIVGKVPQLVQSE